MGNNPLSSRGGVKGGSGILRRSRRRSQDLQISTIASSPYFDPAWQLSRWLFHLKATWFLLGVLVLALLTFRIPLDEVNHMELPGGTTAMLLPLRAKFVLFGDSITQQSFRPGGWGAALADKYARKADVILRGYSGYNTRWALYLLDCIFPRKGGDAPTLVTVFFGANDACLPGRGGDRHHVPISEYKSNLRAIVAHILGLSSSIHVILISPPPVYEPSRLLHQKFRYGEGATGIVERTNKVTGQYAEACKSVGLELGIPVLDLWHLLQEVPGWQRSCLRDGLHLTSKGNRVLFKEVMRIIESEKWSPSLLFDDLPWDFPEHSSVDAQNPKATFKPSRHKNAS